jgi:DNA-binding FadR family transcriptional regulator
VKDSADQSPPKLKAPFVVISSLPTGAAKKAVETLGRLIANDAYQPGEVMPTEPELADKLEVSRATIRDAIKVLSGKGMVRTARRYGTRVRPVAEWNLLDTDVASWHDAGNPRIHRMFTETTELRSILEPEAAALAAERATPEQIQTLLGAAEAMRTENVPDLFAADCLFHATLLDARDDPRASDATTAGATEAAASEGPCLRRPLPRDRIDSWLRGTEWAGRASGFIDGERDRHARP